MDEARAHLLSADVNVDLLDQIVQAMNSPDAETRKQANELLCEFKEHPDSWLKADTILEKSTMEQAKYLALQALQDVIKTRWRTLPPEQRNGIRDFIISKIYEMSSIDPKSTLLAKMNVVLVEILKRDWPRRYPNFVPEFLNVAGTNRGVCVNSMQIFALLSEDVFDFGGATMTQAEVQYLKVNFCEQFEQIFQFCLRCLNECPTDDVVTAVLKTIRRFLTWIPTPSVFESGIIELLVQKFLGMDNYRIHVIDCLGEIAAIPAKNCQPYQEKIKQLYFGTIKILSDYFGQTSLATVYKVSRSENDRILLASLANFMSTFLKEYDSYLEEQINDEESAYWHQYGLKLLLELSMVEELEIWKVCLEYWLELASELFRTSPYARMGASGQKMLKDGDVDPKTKFYQPILSGLRDVVINNMARPEEVTVVEVGGEVIREVVRDTDTINIYRAMKETLVFLTHLDNEDTLSKMTSKLNAQMSETGYDRPKLATLCWAIGSIANILEEEDEKRFLVIIIRDLLSLCEAKRGKDNKAAIAANIMYVVGQYHRFLRAHWKFLRTVINKLFEFMHEPHEGVQDMACDTFIKIVIRCKRHFVVVQQGETQPFIEEMLENLSNNTMDLTNEQGGVFYEAMSHIIAEVSNESEKLAYLDRMMAFVNEEWQKNVDAISKLLQEGRDPAEHLFDLENSRDLQQCVKLRSAVCRAFGFLYHVQITPIFQDMLGIYRFISSRIIAHEEGTVDKQIIKNLKNYKRDFLILMSTWLSHDETKEIFVRLYFSQLMETVLTDYHNNPPEHKDAKVLSLLAIIITRMEADITEHVPAILTAVLSVTMDMIAPDMISYPEHRVGIFQMLLAICREAFSSLISMEKVQFDYILETIYWAFQNSLREVAELGLDLIKEVLSKVKELSESNDEIKNNVAQKFYKDYFVPVLEHVFAVVSDSNQVHIAGMNRFSEILCQLFDALESNIKIRLQDVDPEADNREYISRYLGNLFTQHYSKHLNAEQIRVIILGFFSFSSDTNEMKTHLKDFLVKLKEMQDEQALDQELFLAEREAAVALAMRAKL